MDTLGYHIINANLDTLDWANTGNIQVSRDIYSQNVASNSLVLAHDVHPTTVDGLAEFMMTEALNRGLRRKFTNLRTFEPPRLTKTKLSLLASASETQRKTGTELREFHGACQTSSLRRARALMFMRNMVASVKRGNGSLFLS